MCTDAGDAAAPEEVIAGQRVNLLVKDGGDQYFQIARGPTQGLGRIVEAIRRRI